MQLDFFETVPLSDDERATATQKAKTQNTEVLEYFRFTRRALTPDEVYYGLNCRYLLTSIRRAISTLELRKDLVKTNETATTSRGGKCYKWRAV